MSKSAIKRMKNPQERYRMSKLQLGKIPWNKGLSTKIDKRVLENVRAMLKKSAQRPNKFETRCGAFLELNYPGKFKYCGNGSVLINGRSPDFINTKEKIIVLCQGTYWHLGIHGFKINDKSKGAVQLIESKPFLDKGYKVIFLWEDEI